MLVTEWVARGSFEDNSICRKKDGSLGRQQHWASTVSTDPLIPAIRQQIRPQSTHDDLFTR